MVEAPFHPSCSARFQPSRYAVRRGFSCGFHAESDDSLDEDDIENWLNEGRKGTNGELNDEEALHPRLLKGWWKRHFTLPARLGSSLQGTRSGEGYAMRVGAASLQEYKHVSLERGLKMMNGV
jgi:hypothetical protein